MDLLRKGNWIDLYSYQQQTFVRIVRKATCPVMGVLLLPLVVEHGQTYLVCIANRRLPLGRFVVQLPGGYVDQHQTVEQAAQRELLEETGYRVKQFLFRSPMMYCDPWKSDETEQVLAAVVDETPEKQNLQGQEEILVRKIKVRRELGIELEQMCKEEGFAMQSKMVQIIHGLKMYFDKG